MGASNCGRPYPVTAKTFEHYAASGVRFMEFSQTIPAMANVDWREVKKAAEATGVTVWSFHLPFSNNKFNIAHPDPFVRRTSMLTDEAYIEVAGYLGVKYVVVHPSSEPIADADRPEAIKHSKENLSKLADTAEKCGVTLAVENLPRTCLGNTGEELRDIVNADDRLRVTFDVNHLLKESHASFVKAVGDKIVTLHISDYDFIDERHLLPGKGKIDWKGLLDLLEGIGYDGPFMYEVTMRSDGDTREERLRFPTLSEGVETWRKVMAREL